MRKVKNNANIVASRVSWCADK